MATVRNRASSESEPTVPVRKNKKPESEPFLTGSKPESEPVSRFWLEQCFEPNCCHVYVLVIEALRVEYPPDGVEGMGDSTAQSGQSQTYIEETGPVERASASGSGSGYVPHLINEDEEEDEE